MYNWFATRLLIIDRLLPSVPKMHQIIKFISSYLYGIVSISIGQLNYNKDVCKWGCLRKIGFDCNDK
jgi:hypothetical protein